MCESLVGQFDKQAKFAAKVAMLQASEEATSNLKAAGEVLGLFVDASIASDSPFSTIKERAFGMLEPAAFPSVTNYLRNVAFDKLDWDTIPLALGQLKPPWPMERFFFPRSRRSQTNLEH